MLLSCVVEVSFTRKRVHARVDVSSVNIVFEDSRGAQVGYTGALCTLLSAQRSTAPRTLILLWDRAHVTLARLANAHSQLSPCMITLISTHPLIPFIGSAVTIQIKLVIICI